MEEQEYPGTLGLRNVEVGKAYFVTNGHWDFKVLSIEGDVVTCQFVDGELFTASITASETKHVLFIEESDVNIHVWEAPQID